MKTIAKQLRLNDETVKDVLAICEYYKCNFSDAIRVAIREWAAILRKRESTQMRAAGDDTSVG